jgi:hypothetical protein
LHARRLDTSPVYYVPHPIDDHLVVAVLVPGRDRVQLVEFDHVERQVLREHVVQLGGDDGNVPVVLALVGLGFLRLAHVVSTADATQARVSVRDLEPEEQAVACLLHALWRARRDRGWKPEPESHS